MLTAPESGRPLRVLHVGKFYPPVRGGMETHLHVLCTGLRAHLDVRVLVAGTRLRSTIETADDIVVERSGSLGTLASTSFCPTMSRAIGASGADLVHLHHPNPMAALAYLVSGHRGPLVVTYHSDIVRQRAVGALIAPMIDRLLARAAAIVCTSPNYLASSRVLRRHVARCHVLPFAASAGGATPADGEAVARIRRRYGPSLVLGVGRQVGYKGFAFLVAAMRQVDGTLLLIGDGPERRRLMELAQSQGIAHRVHFLRDAEELAPYYAAADLFVLPSIERSEAFGLVQLEAMASGTPVVNTRLDTGVPYVSVHGVTGLTVPPRDPDALAAAIAALLADRALRDRFGAAGRDRAAALFDARAMVAETASLYERVMAGEGASGRRAIRPSRAPHDAGASVPNP